MSIIVSPELLREKPPLHECLAHHGIKGQKWGVRRFQNKDGSYTDAGKKRAKQQKEEPEPLSDEELAKRVRRLTMEKSYARLSKEATPQSRLDKTKKVVDSTSDLVTQAKKLNQQLSSTSKQQRPRLDLTQMTDKGLRDRINRELLERQYSDMFARPETVSRGRDYVTETLETAGAVLAVGSSALSIALAIKGLKKP